MDDSGSSSCPGHSVTASISSVASHQIECSLRQTSGLSNGDAKTSTPDRLVDGRFVKDLAATAQAQACTYSSPDALAPSLQHTWWALVQDQMSTLQREVNSLRSTLSQVQVRQATMLQRQEEAQAEMSSDVKALLAQVAQEQNSITKELHIEKEERSAEFAKILHKLPELCTTREEVQRMHEQLRTSVSEESRAWHETHTQHGKHLLEALAVDLRAEMSQRTAPVEKVAQDISLLRQAFDKEVHERSVTKDEFSMLSHKLSVAFENEKQSASSSSRMLQMQIANMSNEMEALVQSSTVGNLERKDLAQQCFDLQESNKQDRQAREKDQALLEKRLELQDSRFQQAVAQMRGDMQRTNQELRDQITEEHKWCTSSVEGLRRDLLELQGQIAKTRAEQENCHRQVNEQIAEERTSRVSSGEYVGSQVQEVLKVLQEVSSSQEASHSELSARIVGNQSVIKTSFDNLRIELDEFRGMFDTEVQEHVARERSMQEQFDGKLEEFRGPLLSNLRKDLQDELVGEREFRQTVCNALGTRLDDIHNALCKVRADQALGEAKLQDHVTKLLMQVQDDVGKRFGNVHQSVTDTRQNQEALAVDVQNSARRLVANLVAEEQKQAQALLGRAHQILEADEKWRATLQDTLRQEMVSKSEFSQEIQEMRRLWETMHPKDMESSMCTLPPSPVAPASASPPTNGANHLQQFKVVAPQDSRPGQAQPKPTAVQRSVSASSGLARPRWDTQFTFVASPVKSVSTPPGRPPQFQGASAVVSPTSVAPGANITPHERLAAMRRAMTPGTPGVPP